MLLIVAAVLWSLNGPGVKLVADVSPTAFAMWRSAGAAVVALLLLPAIRPRLRESHVWPPMGRLLIAGLLYTANVTLLVAALRYGTAARAILLQYTGPIWVAIFGRLLFGTTFGRRTAIALGLASVGVLVMLLHTPGGAFATGCGLASGACYGGTILAIDRLKVGERPVDPAATVLGLNVLAAAILLPLTFTSDGPGLPIGVASFLLIFGVLQLAVPYALFQIALPKVGPLDASLIVLLEPVLNPVWTFFAVREVPDGPTLIGGALLLTAMLVEAFKPRRAR